MAVGLSTTAANALLTSLAGSYTWVQLHTADPGANGTTAVAVETDRVQVTWSAPSNGAMSNSAQLQWTAVAGSEDYTHFSVWTASSAGTFGFSGTVTANAVTTGDTFTIPAGDLDVTIPRAS